MSWREVTLDQLGKVSRGRSRHRPRDAAFLYNGPYPFIQTADVKRAGLYLRDFEQTYSEEGLAQSRLWPVGTLCITIAANIAETAVLGIEACFPDSVIGFVADSEQADARYIKYLFDAALKAKFKAFTQGAAQDNLSQEKLLGLKWAVPSVDVQRTVAEVLASYDASIENNRRRIELLEEAARLLYREWFVHLRFPGHEHVRIIDGLPMGWSRTVPENLIASHIGGGWGQENSGGKNSEPAYVVRGTDIPDVESGVSGGVGLRYHPFKPLKARILAPYDIIFEVSGGSTTQPVARTLLFTQQRLKLWSEPVICASFCKRFTMRSKEDAVFFYVHLREHRDRGDVLLYQKESASSLKNFNFEAFMSGYSLILPPDILRKAYFEIVNGLIDQQAALATQIANLAQARDLLLPRLMSGDLAV